MTIFGVDISSYQGSGFNFTQAKAQGVSFAVVKATEGDNYANPYYATQVQNSLNSGLLTMSYHFVHSADENGQVAEVESNARKDLPLWLDSEVDGSGEYGVSVDLVRRLRADGWNVVGTYLPRWFWSQIGSPDLRPLGLLWASGYPGGSGSPAQIYSVSGGDGSSSWSAYGGVAPSLWQFTNKASVAGQSVDCSAFRGTIDQLKSIVFPSPSGGDGMSTFLKKISTGETATQDGPTVSGLNSATEAATLKSWPNAVVEIGLTDAEWEDRVNKSSLLTGIQPALVQLDADVQANTAVLNQILAQLKAAPPSGSAPSAAQVAVAVQAQLDKEHTDQLAALGYVPGTNPPPVM